MVSSPQILSFIRLVLRLCQEIGGIPNPLCKLPVEIATGVEVNPMQPEPAIQGI